MERIDLTDLVSRHGEPQPWQDELGLPWFEPGFSARVLHEHLSQAHDTASRRTHLIKRHVAWIHRWLLHSQPGSVLDLGCGPGLYSQRLAELGHRCTGIDFSPAAIDYAQEQARQAGLPCDYRRGDLRTADFGVAGSGAGYDLAMFLFGEFNTLRPEHAAALLAKVAAALRPGGTFLLEAHSHLAVMAIGREPRLWTAEMSDPFSDQPHLCLRQSAWWPADGVATRRYSIVDAATASVTEYTQSVQAYTRDGYAELLRQAGFTDVAFDDAGDDRFGDPADEFYPFMLPMVARRAPSGEL
jgi:SAM-dependent methyltransferase